MSAVIEMQEAGKCCLCDYTYHDYGNNPWPLSDVESERCCSECDRTLVVPTRMLLESGQGRIARIFRALVERAERNDQEETKDAKED